MAQRAGPQIARALARIATNVAVVTTGPADAPHGVTANVWGESAAPAVVLVTLKRAGNTLDRVIEHGAFVANVLGAGQRDVAIQFTRPERPGQSRFDSVAVAATDCGPRLISCHAWFACRVEHTAPFGSYEIVVGAVQSAGVGARPEPLLFHDNAFVPALPPARR